MAALTTASLVALYEPDLPLDDDPAPPSTFRSHLISSFGLSKTVTLFNIFALLSSGFTSVCFLVFLNSSQVFVLSDLLAVPTDKIGTITGDLILADELLSLGAVFVWGACCDVMGIRWVAVVGNWLVGMSFVAYVEVKSVFPGLLLARLLFAVGASALVTCLSATLAALTAIPRAPDVESEPLLNDNEAEDRRPASPIPKPSNVARFSGVLGFTTGCGALFAVFVLLRLPARIADWLPSSSPTLSLERGIRFTFFLATLIAIFEGIVLIFGLKIKLAIPLKGAEAEGNQVTTADRIKEVVKDLPVGFVVAWKEKEVALAYLSGFATRAQSLVGAAFIPIFVNNFFIRSGLCDPEGGGSLFESGGCRRAFIVSSILTGSIQLVSLLFSPVLGYLSSRFSQPLILSLTCLSGSVSLIFFALLPNGDPRNPLVWIYAVGIGLSQIGGIVVSLALVARTRSEVVAREKREVGGAISGAYSFCGGLGVLLIGKIGGNLLDVWVGSPFMIMGVVNFLVSALAFHVYLSGGFRTRTRVMLPRED